VIKTWRGTSEPASASAIRQHQAHTSIFWIATVIGENGCCDPPVPEHERMHCQQDRVIYIHPSKPTQTVSACCRFAQHAVSRLTHSHMPSSNHRYQHTGGQAMYCSPFVLHPPLSRDAELLYSRELEGKCLASEEPYSVGHRLCPGMAEEELACAGSWIWCRQC
jgi:hypothetical protein